MNNFLKKLNGWQRLFIVLTVVIQVPLTILFASTLPITNPTAKVLNNKFQSTLIEENISSPLLNKLVIDDEISLNFPVNKEGDKLNEMYKESERRGLGKIVTFNFPSQFSMSYYVYFTNLMGEEEQLKAKKLIQQLIEKEFSKSHLNNYLITIAYSIFLSIAIYVLGLSIGWVIRGFRKA